jgi:hypothetical protein
MQGTVGRGIRGLQNIIRKIILIFLDLLGTLTT